MTCRSRWPGPTAAAPSSASTTIASYATPLAPLRRFKPVMRAEAGCCFGRQVAAKDRLFESLHNLDDDSIELHAPGGLIGTFNLFGADPDLMAWQAPDPTASQPIAPLPTPFAAASDRSCSNAPHALAPPFLSLLSHSALSRLSPPCLVALQVSVPHAGADQLLPLGQA